MTAPTGDAPRRTSRDDPVERLVETALYAPIGLLVAARDALPQWIEIGRRQLSTQIPLARTVGELAVRHGSRQAREGLERLRRQADDLLNDSSAGPDARSPDPPGPAGPPEPAPILSDLDGPEDPGPPPSPEAGVAVSVEDDIEGIGGVEGDDDVLPDDLRASFLPPEAPRPDVGELPIPGYDTLSASQVVQRLPGLSMEELEKVRAYELASRARKTVLLRVAQLRAAS